ncbi:MAG: hypothetical protein K0R54_1921 [Clostridiaceae bacterium]|jgi:cation transport ATPase|nr:hypothetical protein [Clostridiaceae bacterium]
MEKLNSIKHNFFRIGTYLMGFVLAILIYFNNVSKAITIISMTLIIVLIISSLIEISQVKISLSSAHILTIIKTAIEGLLLILLCIACLFIITLFSGYISVLLNGYFNIDTRSWLGFIGAFLSGMLGVFGGSLGVMIFSKANILNYSNKEK